MRWFALEVFFPIMLVVMIWEPGQSLVLQSYPHLFEKVFSSAELLPVTMAILLAFNTELRTATFQKGSRAETLAGWCIFGVPIALVFIAIIYAWAKLVYLNYHFPTADQPVDRSIQAVIRMTFALTFFASAIAFVGRLTLMRKE